MAIPLGTLAPKPKQEKPAPPSEDKLRELLANGLGDVVVQLIQHHELKFKVENGMLMDALEGTELWLKKFITEDEDCIAMKEEIKKLAKCDDEVLITGQTGTGKEIIARSMIGDRNAPFIAINCAGLPEALMESELFGHARGSFTGADSQKQGLLAAAKDGVLFLDEIGELPISVQAKLLRALQDRVIRKVGSNVEEEIRCKFVCATHRDIRKMVEDGEFRQDLFARISTFELHIKPLEDRVNDIPLIASSIKGGKEWWAALEASGKTRYDVNVSLNVRSIQQYIKRWAVLGRLSYT